MEVSPQSAAAAADLARRVAASSGAALIIDYGTDAPANDSLRWTCSASRWTPDGPTTACASSVVAGHAAAVLAQPLPASCKDQASENICIA